MRGRRVRVMGTENAHGRWFEVCRDLDNHEFFNALRHEFQVEVPVAIPLKPTVIQSALNF